MAIDDSTSYELTGAQVKDLANKIKGKAADNTFVGATPAAPGSKGLVPEPQAGDDGNVLKGDGSFSKVTSDNIDWPNILDHFYPVGSIYMSTTLSTPAEVGDALGGTWVAWGAGRVPVGVDASDTAFDTVEETGGEKTHTLTIEEMPSHTHNIYDVDTGSGGQGKRDGLYYQGGWWGNSVGAPNVGNTGGSRAHNNLQPYITCYMYKRTA